MTKVNIKLLDETLGLPAYQTEGSAAFDLYSREHTLINPMQMALVPLNICLEIPEGHFAMLVPRSSLYKKKNLIMVNGVGIIDSDYSGDNDEYKIQLLNMGPTVSVIEKGERIAQVLIIPITKLQFNQVKAMPNKTRGGFGSTDKR